jgi:hypothetical protein
MQNKDTPIEGYAEGEKPLIFYYNRERRVARAPKIVQDYYNGKNRPVTGLFKVLVATPAKRVMFFSIIALCVIVIFLNYSLGEDSAGTIGGVPASLSAFAFEDTVYISLRFDGSPKFKDELRFAVDIAIFNADNQLFETRRFFQNYSGKEAFTRTTIPDYDILRIEAVVTLEDADAAAANTAVAKLKTTVSRK